MQQIIERIGVLVCYRYRSDIGIYRVDWRNIGIGSMLRIDRTLLLNIICIMLTSRYGKTILSPYIRPQIRTYPHQTIIANYYQTVPELKKSECCCMFNRSIPIHVHSGFLNTKSI